VGLGTHTELLAADGLYAAMYRRQMGDLASETLKPATRRRKIRVSLLSRVRLLDQSQE
jgi:hypothetical protein